MPPHVSVSLTGSESNIPGKTNQQEVLVSEKHVIDAAKRLLLPAVYVPEVNFRNAMGDLGGVDRVRRALLNRSATEQTKVTELCVNLVNSWQKYEKPGAERCAKSLTECARELVQHVDPTYTFTETLSFSRSRASQF
jgi:hypothetical protein